MKEFVEYIQNNIVNVISISLSAIGAILTIYFYLKSVRVKKPFYTSTSFNLLGDKLNEISHLEIRYLNKEIKSLTATKIAIWNAGKETINKKDIPENAPLRIISKANIQIYSAELNYSTEISNQMKIIFDEDLNEILIDFEYLDYAEGGIIKVLHSGISSSDLKVEGKVKGAGNFTEPKDEIRFNRVLIILQGIIVIPMVVFVFTDINSMFLYIPIILGIILFVFQFILVVTKIPKNIRSIFNQ